MYFVKSYFWHAFLNDDSRVTQWKEYLSARACRVLGTMKGGCITMILGASRGVTFLNRIETVALILSIDFSTAKGKSSA